MHTPEAKETLNKQGYDPVESGPDQFAAFIRSELARWSAVARDARLKS
jgi:tripartite-type tricarboxylate transporter receptor subunit TctC